MKFLKQQLSYKQNYKVVNQLILIKKLIPLLFESIYRNKYKTQEW